jgi:hypothetical protein
MASEQTIQQEIRIACSTGATRLWRNNTGRPVSFGLCKGSADLIGYRSITITPEMVGQQVAVFAMASEQQIQQHIRIACSTGQTRLFRNNTGTLRDQHGRPVQFGLARGSADLIGYRTITITPDMVGQQVAVLTPTGRIRPEQRAWMETVQAAGGIAGVARSVEDAKALLAAQPDGVPGASHKQSAE